MKTRTVVGSLALVAIEVLLLYLDITQPVRALVAAVPPFTLIATAAQGIRGYTLTADALQIKHWGWTARLSLADLQSVEGKADALEKSIRLWANSGFFAFSGLYWSRELKLFRVLATDASRAVVLRFEHKRVVISPHDPQQFIVRARTDLKNKQFPK